MSKDTNEKQIDFSKVDLIIYAIYESEKFKTITKNFIEVLKLKNNLTTEEIQPLFEDFLYNIIFSKIDNLDSPKKVQRLRTKHTNNAWDLKQRWVKMTLASLEKKQNKYLNKEYEESKKIYIKNGFITPYIDTPEELLNERKRFLDQWAANREYNVSDYLYLNELSDSKVQSSFKHDLILCICDILKDDYDYDIDRVKIESPSGLAPGLFIPRKRGRKSHTNTNIARQDENSYKSKMYDAKNSHGDQMDLFYEFNFDNKNIMSKTKNLDGIILELNSIDDGKRSVSTLSLDKQDLDIARFTYSYSPLINYSFYLSDLLEDLELSDSKENYENVINKLMKLPFYTFYTETYNEDGTVKTRSSFNLFSQITTQEINGRKTVKVTKSIVEEVERETTRIMYKNQLKKLKIPQSTDLAYMLEGIRISEVNRGVNIKDKKYTFDLDQLKFDIHFEPDMNEKERMKMVENMLNEIVENQFIIKRFDVGHGYFDIYFYEDVEKRKSLINNTVLSLPTYIIQ
nr:hypothetical protein [Clostridioides sp.]